MSTFEMPYEELLQYAGRNPRPADFDAYWKRGLDELEATPPAVELIPRENPARFAECFDLWFTGTGGARVHSQYLRPISPGLHPALLRFHGYSMNAWDWFDKLAWVAQGFAVAALDVRGQGGLSEDAGGVSGTTLRGHIIRGHQQIHETEIKMWIGIFNQAHGVYAVVRHRHLVPATRKDASERAGDNFFVVDYEDFHSCSCTCTCRGRKIRNSVPLPSVLVTSMRAPIL